MCIIAEYDQQKATCIIIIITAIIYMEICPMLFMQLIFSDI